MTTSKITHRSLSVFALAGLAGGIGASAASAATLPPLPPAIHAEVYVHLTDPSATKAGCMAAIASDTKRINNLTTKLPSGSYTNIASVTSSTACDIGNDGWQSKITYASGTKLKASDQYAGDMWAGQIVINHYTHGTRYHGTKASAQEHLTWALSQFKAKTDAAVVDSSKVYANGDGTYSYEVAYHAKAHTPFFVEDGSTWWAIA